jgi:dihydroflavonol-4-reductase
MEFERRRGDVTDLASVKDAMAGCEVVYHTAGLISFSRSDWDRLYEINVIGTRNVLRAAMESGVDGLVFTSAGAVLGCSSSPKVWLDETARLATDESDGYAYSKQLAEREVRAAAKQGLHAVIVNPATVYGRGDLKLNSGFVIRNIYRHGARVAPPGGTSAVAVQDLVDGHLLAMQRGSAGERYILSGQNLTYLELFNTIAQTVGARSVKWQLPRAVQGLALLAAAVLEWMLGLVDAQAMLITPKIVKETFGYKWFDTGKAQRELGWIPRVPLRDAVREAFDFYREQGLI